MTDTTAPSLKRAALGDLAHELATTRRVLARVPDEHLAWKPHEKSFSLGALAGHIADLTFLQVTIVERDEFDLSSRPAPAGDPESRDELLRRFDEGAAALTTALEGLDDAALGAPWTMKRNGQVLIQQPRLAALRSMGISHLVHHRAQLGVYLRLLDVPLPPVYGPSADEGR